MAASQQSFPEAIAVVQDFCDAVDSGRLFKIRSADTWRHTRKMVRQAIYQLLFFDRPALAAAKGVDWPYEVLRSRRTVFTHLVSDASQDFFKEQALLTLARLPFPGQWHWLHKATTSLARDPEIAWLLAHEAAKNKKNWPKSDPNSSSSTIFAKS